MTFVTQAIETKFIRATDITGERIKATAFGGSVTVPYAHELSVQDAHKAAALTLIDKMGWQGTFAQGGNAKGDGYYFVNVEGATPDLLAALDNLLALTELHIAERSKTPEEEAGFLSCHHIAQARAASTKAKGN